MLQSAETEKALKDFANQVIELMKQELGTLRSRSNYRASWKNGKLSSFRVTKSARRIDPNGELGKSLDYNLTKKGDSFLLEFSGTDYAIYVNDGREPGKWIPVDAMNKWLKSPRIKLQNLVKGKDGKLQSRGFLPKTNKNIESIGFLMNRKIKTFGIEAIPFIDEAVRRTPEKLDNLEFSVARDIAVEIAERYNGTVV